MACWNEQAIAEKTRAIHEEYLRCKALFAPSELMVEQDLLVPEGEEREFYELVFEFFLQQKQKEVIKEGVY